MKPPENEEEILELFKQGPAILEDALSGMNDIDLDYVPTDAGWSVREIVHHIVDGDDIWKICIKMALGNEKAEFSLPWYWVFPQTEWAKAWVYKHRSIDLSLALFRANRNHVVQLLEYADDGWTKSAQFRKNNGEIEVMPVGAIIQLQADHVVHHIKRISEIREEMAGNPARPID